jgi:hypothetical protein
MTTLSSIITPNNLVTATNAETLTNKTIDGDNNTITNIELAGDVKGTLPVANGGTGVTTSTGSGNVVLSTSPAITTPTITGTKETKVAIAASEIDLSAGNYFTKTISGTTTFTVANTASSGSVSAFILDLTNGGSATVNWFSGVTWAAGTPPTLTASGRDVLGFFTYDAGTTWSGFVLGLGMA